MDFEEKLKGITVGDFMVTLEASPRHDFGPHSINRRVCGYLNGAYGLEASMWDVVVDGPPVWHLTGGCGPKIIEALAKAINIEMGAPIVALGIPAKERREEGYFWTIERLKEASAMLDGGSSYREVALHYGRSVDGMKAALKRYGMYKPRFSAQWQPIATAPKDGTTILAVWKDDGRITMIEWFIVAGVGGSWSQSVPGLGADHGYDSSAFTHWMPLPPPPKE